MGIYVPNYVPTKWLSSSQSVHIKFSMQCHHVPNASSPTCLTRSKCFLPHKMFPKPITLGHTINSRNFIFFTFLSDLQPNLAKSSLLWMMTPNPPTSQKSVKKHTLLTTKPASSCNQTLESAASDYNQKNVGLYEDF